MRNEHQKWRKCLYVDIRQPYVPQLFYFKKDGGFLVFSAMVIIDVLFFAEKRVAKPIVCIIDSQFIPKTMFNRPGDFFGLQIKQNDSMESTDHAEPSSMLSFHSQSVSPVTRTLLIG